LDDEPSPIADDVSALDDESPLNTDERRPLGDEA